jgi:hypothetical protein
VVLSAVGLAMAVGLMGSEWALSNRRERRPTIWRSAVATSAFAVIVSVAVTQWPLRAAYALSTSALEDAARRLRAGEQLETPRLVGLVIVRRAELAEYVRPLVCLWTDLAPNGKTGFVQWTGDDEPLSLWSNRPLTDGWHFVTED